jgi:hypothetical protein
MCRKLVFLTFLVLVLGLANSASAVYLKVDVAYPNHVRTEDPNHQIRYDGTVKPGWYPYTDGHWDLSRHDLKWVASGGGFTASGIEGSAVDAMVTIGYEGDASLKVYGMTFVDDGKEPNGLPLGEPLANSYIISHRHWGYEPNIIEEGRTSHGSIRLKFRGGGLVKGIYTLTTYHNCPNNVAFDLISPVWEPGEENMDWFVELVC